MQVHNARTMNDKNKGLQEPVLTPGESWHLGRMDALQAAARIVRKYTRRSNVSVADVARAVDRDLVELTDESLLGYYESAGQVCTTADPPTVVFDPEVGVPLLLRPPTLEGGWGIIDLADHAGGEPMILATPFRATDLKALPKDSRLIKIRDPGHSALAAVIEVLDCMRRDLGAAAVATSEDAAINRVARLLLVYSSAASFAVNALDEDDFADWTSSIPDVSDITKAPAAISAVALKARAQAAVSLQLCALWLATLSDEAADAPAGKRIDHVASALDDALMKLRPLLDSMNRFLAGHDLTDVDFMVISRHAMGSLPVLAVIPKSASSLRKLREEVA